MNNSFSKQSQDQSFASLLEQYEPRQMPIIGQVERGNVIVRTAHGAWIRMDRCKSEVFAPEDELQNGTCAGQEVIFKVLSEADAKGPMIVSCKKAVIWKQLIMAKEAGLSIMVHVESVKRDERKISGVRVRLGDERLRGFIPFSLLAVRASNVANLLNSQMEVAIEDIDLKTGRVTLNRKVLEDERRALENTRLDGMIAGTIFENAKVMSIASKDGNEYGLFVEVDGIRGLLHRSEIPFARQGNLSSRYPVGCMVHVVVQSINPPRKTNGNRTLSLSMKAYNMQEFSKRFKPGDIVSGNVDSRVTYGAFIALPAGVDGLLHKNEFDPVRSRLSLHDTVRVRILSIDPEAGRVSLSMRR